MRNVQMNVVSFNSAVKRNINPTYFAINIIYSELHMILQLHLIEGFWNIFCDKNIKCFMACAICYYSLRKYYLKPL